MFFFKKNKSKEENLFVISQDIIAKNEELRTSEFDGEELAVLHTK